MPERIALTGARLITPFGDIERGTLIIEGETIAGLGMKEHISLPPGAREVDLEDRIVMPGFIDVHIHGGWGVRASEGTREVETVAGKLPRTGVTSWLPTVGRADHLEGVVGAIERDPEGAGILGIHLEGPFLAPKELPGVDESRLETPDLEAYANLLQRSRGHLKLMGLAPELEGALEVIREMVRTGVVAAAAHSRATYREFMMGVEAGIRHVTHTYNVMSGFHHRRPGVTGGALTCGGLTAELICDGVHVHPVAVDMLYRCRGAGDIALVTDSTAMTGLPDGRYGELIKEGGRVRRADFDERTDGTLAGSVWTFDHDLRQMVNFTGCPLVEVARMSSLNPAATCGVERTKGSLEAGKDADLVVLDRRLEVVATWREGQVVYERGEEG